jgi:hypothetical protein
VKIGALVLVAASIIPAFLVVAFHSLRSSSTSETTIFFLWFPATTILYVALLGSMERWAALSTGLLTAVGVTAFILTFPNPGSSQVSAAFIGGSAVSLLVHAAILGSLVDRGWSQTYRWMLGAILCANAAVSVCAIVGFIIAAGTREAPDVLGMLTVAGGSSAILSAALTTLGWRLVEKNRL